MKNIIVITLISLTLSTAWAGDMVLKGFTFDGGQFVPTKNIRAILFDGPKTINHIELKNDAIIYGEEVEKLIIEKSFDKKLKSGINLQRAMMLEGGDRTGGGALK